MERRFSKMRVWVNGTFDVLHIGHIELLKFASVFGKVRVGIDTDSRVKQFKGDGRPVNTWEDRKTLMDSIRYVYDVVGFSTDDELRQQIKDWETDVMIVGSDYKDKNVIGSELVKEVIFFDRIEGYSTTNTLKNV
jgi:D-beta-D-heptose 7-phosphate kinase/D-beta-D-heptose 1-phosphate adenosyltransferase